VRARELSRRQQLVQQAPRHVHLVAAAPAEDLQDRRVHSRHFLEARWRQPPRDIVRSSRSAHGHLRDSHRQPGVSICPLQGAAQRLGLTMYQHPGIWLWTTLNCQNACRLELPT